MTYGLRATNHPQQIAAHGTAPMFVLEDDPHRATDDRRTPPDLLAECLALAGLDGIDLDVAATIDNTLAPHWCADGLLESWWGRVWCNPPYSDLEPWTRKAFIERQRCERIVMLLPANRTEQRWWQHQIEPARLAGQIAVHFLARRRRFDQPTPTPKRGDRPPFGLAVVVI